MSNNTFNTNTNTTPTLNTNTNNTTPSSLPLSTPTPTNIINNTATSTKNLATNTIPTANTFPKIIKVPFKEHFHKFVNNKVFSDVTFYVGKKQKPIYSHQSVLLISSPFFRSQFLNDQGIQKHPHVDITLKDVQPENFENLLHFLYTGVISLTKQNYKEIQSMAHLFGLTKLSEHCSTYSNNLSIKQLKRSASLPFFFNKLPRELYSVAVLTADIGLQTSEHICECVMLNGLIKRVSTLQIGTFFPYITTLLSFHVILVYTDQINFTDSKAIGDLLGTYVTEGGTVILLSSNALIKNNELQLEGAIASDDFLPFSKNYLLKDKLISIDPSFFLSNSKLLKNIIFNQTTTTNNLPNQFQTKRIFAKNVVQNSKILLKYDDDHILVAERQFPNYPRAGSVIVLNSNTPSSFYQSGNSGWNSQLNQLISNIIEYSLKVL
ncbi:btb (poz) domain-containing 2a-related [Anaeramoeba flamelloides]|uniref:Btb (Poz) domain-containing 2a-related n=1 Tax=Anaeramoeba flamelloides TaxID=1746091 RepID=A0AAV7YLH8_9EUKA|nr:btb (poz) domain-containing 2a-related [Anaeramoeba flamelloides]